MLLKEIWQIQKFNTLFLKAKKLVESFLKNDNPVIYIKDCHEENAVEFNRFPKHCVRGTKESKMVDELIPFEKEVIVFEKNSTSAMFATNFLDTINEMDNLEEVVIIGCCTDICVMNLAIPLQNYFDEVNMDVKIVVPKNAVETYDAPVHPKNEYNEMAFKFMQQAGIKVVNNY